MQFAKGMVSDDPAEIRQATAAIAPIRVPERLKPKMSMNLTIPFVGKHVMSMVGYEDSESHSGLLLGAFSAELDNPDQMRDQMSRQATQSGAQESRRDLRIEKSEDYDITINGAPAKFVIASAVDRKTDVPYWDVRGTFESSGGPAMLMMHLNANEFDREQVTAIIDSLGAEPNGALPEEQPKIQLEPAEEPSPTPAG
jgi:hypothetical protein